MNNRIGMLLMMLITLTCVGAFAQTEEMNSKLLPNDNMADAVQVEKVRVNDEIDYSQVSLNDLAKQFNLEEGDHKKFLSIIEKYEKKFKSVQNKPEKANHDKTLKKAVELRKSQNEELIEILSPEQMEEYALWKRAQQKKARRPAKEDRKKIPGEKW